MKHTEVETYRIIMIDVDSIFLELPRELQRETLSYITLEPIYEIDYKKYSSKSYGKLATSITILKREYHTCPKLLRLKKNARGPGTAMYTQ
ncbi:MAG: hypothetical protein CMM15_15115 [Rhodospirillaceae bacterium]|nr:hypothetical protein [Rhodospirillaceae bacterium]